jgi:hypothetical protein
VGKQRDTSPSFVIFPRIHICHREPFCGGNPNKYLSHVETETRNETAASVLVVASSKSELRASSLLRGEFERKWKLAGYLSTGPRGGKALFPLYSSFFLRRSEMHSDRNPRTTRLPGDARRKGREREREFPAEFHGNSATGPLHTMATGKHPGRP